MDTLLEKVNSLPQQLLIIINPSRRDGAHILCRVPIGYQPEPSESMFFASV